MTYVLTHEAAPRVLYGYLDMFRWARLEKLNANTTELDIADPAEASRFERWATPEIQKSLFFTYKLKS